jgi:hypothetical protein
MRPESVKVRTFEVGRVLDSPEWCSCSLWLPYLLAIQYEYVLGRN